MRIHVAFLRRLAATGGLCLAVISCATAPPTAPIGQSELSVCGGRVANAPRTNKSGALVNFDPVANVRGVALARAPAAGCVSSGFGPRRGGAGRMHEGLDLFTRKPTRIAAAGDGVVESVKSIRGYGKTVLIRHRNKVQTRYAHLSAYAKGLTPGDQVKGGQMIGLSGRTGNASAVHLHYEILVNGVPKNPLTVGR